MARAPLNVHIFPFRQRADGAIEYALFHRSDEPGFWQAVAGGAEDGETPQQAACRELFEETGITAPTERWLTLDARGSVPATVFRDWRLWGPDLFVVHIHAFGVAVTDADHVRLSHEHTEWRWLDFETASRLMRYDHTALWELNERLARRLAPAAI